MRVCLRFVSTLAVTILLGSFEGASAQEIQISKDNKTVAITTSAEASALADVAIVSIGFESFGKDSDATYGQASGISNAIIASLTAAGIAKDAIESADQGLRPVEQNDDQEKARYATGIRFEFSQHWRVTVPAVKAATVLQIAIPAGANESGTVEWGLKDEDVLQAEAARKALEQARGIASTMAQSLGAKIGNLLYASNQAPTRTPFTNVGMGFGSGMGGGIMQPKLKVAPLALSPARLSRSATVYAAFAIE